MLLVKKCHFFSPVIFGKIRLEIMHNYFEEKKETFLTTNSRIFQTPKSRFFFKGVNPCFWSKNANYLVYLDLVKLRLEIMLSDFADKKETCFDYKKQNFSKSKKSTFPKETPYMLLVKKCHFFSS